MRIAWLGCRNVDPPSDVANVIERDDRVDTFETLPLDASPATIEASIADCRGVVLGVHHFEPQTSRWFARLRESLDPIRWRAALGPFALVAGRAPFDVLHRQGIVGGDAYSVCRWLDQLASPNEPPAVPVPQRTLVWAPSEERCGVDPDLFLASAGPATTSPVASLLTPRRSGLPFLPDLVVAWIPADLGREERVHLGQLAGAAPQAARIAVYASPSAKTRTRFAADAALVWPYDARTLLHAAGEIVAAKALSPSADRAA